MLEWNGTKLSQSMAICRFIAKQANLAGNTGTSQIFNTICSAVFTYFGYNQTNRQADQIGIYSDQRLYQYNEDDYSIYIYIFNKLTIKQGKYVN